MDRTRSSLAEKIGALESQVSETVGGVTTAVETVKDTVTGVSEAVSSVSEQVTDTVQNLTSTVTGTVNTLTDSVSGTVNSLTESVSGTVQTVKESLDPTPAIQANPWASVGCSVLCGMVAGYLTGGSRHSTGYSNGFNVFGPSRAEGAPPPTYSSSYAPSGPTDHAASASGSGSVADSASAMIGPMGDTLSEIGGAVKSLGISAIMGLVSNLAKDAVPDAIRGDVCGAIDKLKTRLGGRHAVNPSEFFGANNNDNK